MSFFCCLRFCSRFRFIFPFFAIVLLSNFDYSIVRLSKFSIYKLNSIDWRLNKKNKSQISKILEKTTVKIDGINEGSGVIVKRNGKYLFKLCLEEKTNNC